MLIGSLSNDLYRVASLTFSGSTKSAVRFFQESKKWSNQLTHQDTADYIKKIIDDINTTNENQLSIEKAEALLMYSTLLQNYSLKLA